MKRALNTMLAVDVMILDVTLVDVKCVDISENKCAPSVEAFNKESEDSTMSGASTILVFTFTLI